MRFPDEPSRVPTVAEKSSNNPATFHRLEGPRHNSLTEDDLALWIGKHDLTELTGSGTDLFHFRSLLSLQNGQLWS
jgi:hypothetical protein